MKRKVIKQGNNTLTITLPRKWANLYKVEAGKELEVEEQASRLVISASGAVSKQDTITVDITGLDRSSTVILIQSLYRYGYDNIEIRTENTSFPHFRIGKEVPVAKVIHDTVARFIGSEIIGSSPKYFSIKKISEESNDEFDVVLRRVFRLLNDMIAVFVEAVEKNDRHLLESVEQHHVNVKKFVNYCLRLLNKFGHGEIRKTTFYYSIIQYLSKIDDFVKNAARYIAANGYKLGQKSIRVVKNIQKSVTLYYELFYDYSLKKICEITKWRDEVRNSCFKMVREYSKEELIILGGLMQIIEILLDMTELRMALEI